MTAHPGHGWFYWDFQENVAKGPFTPAQIRERVTDKTLTLTSMLWHETQSPYYTPICALVDIGLAMPVPAGAPPPTNCKLPPPPPSHHGRGGSLVRSTSAVVSPSSVSFKALKIQPSSDSAPPVPASPSIRPTLAGPTSQSSRLTTREPPGGYRPTTPRGVVRSYDTLSMSTGPGRGGRGPPRASDDFNFNVRARPTNVRPPLVRPPRTTITEHRGFAALKGEGDAKSQSSVSLMNHYQVDQPPKVSKPEGSPRKKEQQPDCDFLITRVGKLGINQDLMIVLSNRDKTFRMVDREKRAVLKKYDVPCKQILSVEIPKDKDETLVSPCTMTFATETKLKPLTVSFTDHDERLLFTSELNNLSPDLELKDNREQEDEREILRFAISKVNAAGFSNSVIIALITSTRTLTWYGKGKAPKSWSLKDVTKCERAYDKRKCDVYFENRPVARFMFVDAASREKFLGRLNQLWDLSIAERDGPSGVDSSRVKVMSISWNCGGSSPPSNDILRLCFGQPGEHDIYVINLQECSKKRDVWGSDIKAYCEATTHRLEIISTVRLWDMVIIVLIKEQLVRFITHVEADTIACGIGDVLGNKGGIGVSFHFRDTPLCFVNCHLAARAERLAQRQGNYIRIVDSLQLGLKSYDILNQFSHVLWAGDLNYRVEADFHKTIEDMTNRNFAPLVAADQLTNEMILGKVLLGFREGPLNFAPTYRWDRHSQEVSNKREQTPSWTDRILWRSFPGIEDELQLTCYRSVPEAFGSDHRPIVAHFVLFPRKAYTGSSVFSIAAHTASHRKHIDINFTAPRVALEKETEANFQEHDQIALVFTSSILDQSVSPPALAYVPGLTGSWTWSNEAASLRLSPFIFDRDVILKSNFLVSFSLANKPGGEEDDPQGIEDYKVEDKGLIGGAVIPLTNVFDPQAAFTVPITKGGQKIGTFSGCFCIKEKGTVDLVEIARGSQSGVSMRASVSGDARISHVGGPPHLPPPITPHHPVSMPRSPALQPSNPREGKDPPPPLGRGAHFRLPPVRR